MVRQKLTLAERWQAVGMSNAGFTHIRGAGQTGTPSVIDRIMQRVQATGMIDERPRSGMACKTIRRNDRLIDRRARRNRLATSARIRYESNLGGRVSVRIGNSAKRLIKRPQLLIGHRRPRWNQSRDHFC